MEILLPKRIEVKHLEVILKIANVILKEDGPVVLNACDLNFIDPLATVILRVAIEKRRDKSVRIDFLHRNIITHLTRMGFFDGVNIEGVDYGCAEYPLEEAVRITKIQDYAQAESIATMLATGVTRQLTDHDPGAPENGIDGRNDFERYRYPLEYSLKELLENSFTHARREGKSGSSVWVAFHVTEREKRVRMVIVDDGCGFLSSLRNHPRVVSEQTDIQAIQAALEPKVSCNRSAGLNVALGESENQGIGLTVTASIAKEAKGHLVIVSGNGWGETKNVRFESFTDADISWDGVCILFSCISTPLPTLSVSSLMPAEEEIEGLEFSFS